MNQFFQHIIQNLNSLKFFGNSKLVISTRITFLTLNTSLTCTLILISNIFTETCKHFDLWAVKGDIKQSTN